MQACSTHTHTHMQSRAQQSNASADGTGLQRRGEEVPCSQKHMHINRYQHHPSILNLSYTSSDTSSFTPCYKPLYQPSNTPPIHHHTTTQPPPLHDTRKTNHIHVSIPHLHGPSPTTKKGTHNTTSRYPGTRGVGGDA